jgi:hypothetical protein
MDFFKLGVRNILGIALPGTILVFTCLYCIWACEPDVEVNPVIKIIMSPGGSLFFVTAGFVLSFFIGSIVRLYSVDVTDAESRWYRQKMKLVYKPTDIINDGENKKWVALNLNDKKIEELFEKNLKQIYRGEKIDDEMIANLDKFDKYFLEIEKFPMIAWQIQKVRKFHSEKDQNIFFSNIKPYLFDDKSKAEIWANPFFNYCKMKIYNHFGDFSSPIVEEITYSEALTRFYAGLFVNLKYSMRIIVLVFILWSFFSDKWEWSGHFYLKTAMVLYLLSVFLRKISFDKIVLFFQRILGFNLFMVMASSGILSSILRNFKGWLMKRGKCYWLFDLVTMAAGICIITEGYDLVSLWNPNWNLLIWLIPPLFIFYLGKNSILHSYVKIRQKEVDAVFDAFYLVSAAQQTGK